jgi:dynein heavy chain
LSTVPSLDVFRREFEQFFETTIESIQVVERWSKHTEFLPYAEALEEWDEVIGEKWIMPDNRYLGIMWYLKENPKYKIFQNQINYMFELSFNRTNTLLGEFNYYLDFYWRDTHTSFEILGNNRLKEQNFIYNTLYKMYKQINQKFEENIINIADIGLFRILLHDVRKTLVPKPQSTIDHLEVQLPQIMRARSQATKEWLQESIRKLSGIVAGIEEFIEQKNNFNKISVEYESRRPGIDTLYEFFQLLQDNNFPLANDDKEQFNKLGILISDLSSALQNVEMATNKNTDRFTKTLSERIGRLLQDAKILREELVQGPYLDPTDKPEKVMEELGKIDKTVSEFEKTSESYKFYEEVLQV